MFKILPKYQFQTKQECIVRVLPYGDTLHKLCELNNICVLTTVESSPKIWPLSHPFVTNCCCSKAMIQLLLLFHFVDAERERGREREIERVVLLYIILTVKRLYVTVPLVGLKSVSVIQ